MQRIERPHETFCERDNIFGFIVCGNYDGEIHELQYVTRYPANSLNGIVSYYGRGGTESIALWHHQASELPLDAGSYFVPLASFGYSTQDLFIQRRFACFYMAIVDPVATKNGIVKGKSPNFVERKVSEFLSLTYSMPVQFAPAAVEAALDNRFTVGPHIAVGGQGAVFRATRTSRPDGTAANDVVALKLHLYHTQDIRAQREIAAMENIAHPALARLVEHGSCDVAGRRTRYVAWEFIQGKTLSQQLKIGRMEEPEVLAIGRDVSSAIAEIWSQRIVHGDIKPSNIMLRDSGGTVLIDLGAARFLTQENTPASREPFGTRGYFSPEQFRAAKGLSCASDIFSLGVVMLQALLGRHPTGYSQAALADGIRASETKLSASAGLLSELDRMLSARPTARPQPAELSRRLQRLYESIQVHFAMDLPARSRPGASRSDEISGERLGVD